MGQEVDQEATPVAATPAIALSGVSRSFGERRVLNDIDLTLNPGEFVVLVGASGCGKSTLLRIVAGLDSEAEGEVVVTPSKAIVFQDPRLLPWKTVWENVALGLREPKAVRRERALDALTEVGLASHADAWPLTLSGGEAQRVGLARALVRTPQLLLLDEPLAALDALTRLKMQQQIIALWQKHHLAALFVTHDVDEALLLADRILLLENGAMARRFDVTLERPRNRQDPLFVEIRRELLLALGVDEAASGRKELPEKSDSNPEVLSGIAAE